jgi:RNA polymerase sigma-70 factor (ECF subfamily)
LESLCEQSIPVCGPDLGSKEDFEAFVKQHMKDAYLTALGLVGNREDALELSQEAFFRAYQHYDQLNTKGKFFAWFYQILRNLCFSHLRKRRVRKAHELRIEDGGPGSKSGMTSLRIGDTDDNPQSAICNPQSDEGGDHFDPEAIAERNEAKDRIWRAIGRLDEKHREVIILRHFQNLSYDEMATRLFCNRGTVTSRLFYARQKLKEILEQETGSPNAKDGVGGPQKGGQTS